MSYDLFIRPPKRTQAGASIPTLPAVDDLIRRQPGVRSTDRSLQYTFDDPSSGLVEVFLEVEADRVLQIEVSASFDGTPTRMWDFTAAVARGLKWRIYDPQGDTWHAPDQLSKATSGAVPIDAELVRGLMTVGGVAAALIGGLVWALLGSPREGPWFWVALLGILTFAGARLWDRWVTRG